MQSRRQEKVSRVVKEAVSDAIANHIGDPRLQGFISVTEVSMSPNLRDAEIYLSIFGVDEKAASRTFAAIEHAKPKVQAIVAAYVRSRYCPVLHFHRDDKLKRAGDIIRIIDEAVGEPKKEEDKDKED